MTQGDPVDVSFLQQRPVMGAPESRRATVRQGEYAGPVPWEPSMSRVRIGGTLLHAPTEYVSVATPAAKAATGTYRQRIAREQRHSAGQRGVTPGRF